MMEQNYQARPFVSLWKTITAERAQRLGEKKVILNIPGDFFSCSLWIILPVLYLYYISSISLPCSLHSLSSSSSSSSCFRHCPFGQGVHGHFWVVCNGKRLAEQMHGELLGPAAHRAQQPAFWLLFSLMSFLSFFFLFSIIRRTFLL